MMIKNLTLEYGLNTILAIALALVALLPFYFIFGNTLALWSAIGVFGMPHIIIATLGLFAAGSRKAVLPFGGAFLLGLLLTVVFYKILPLEFAYFVFFAYFVWHMLANEQMFEATIVKGGYKIWQNSWPIAISWGSIVLILVSFSISAAYLLKVTSISLIIALWVIFGLSIAVLVYGFFKEKKNKGNIPYGFLSLFVLIFIPAVLLFGFLAKTGAYIPTVFIALFHFASWYVFYTKRLLKYPKDEQEIGIGKLFFGWRRNVRQLWLSIAILQLIFVGVVVLWRNSFAPNVTGLLVAPFWVPFWTIIHLTVSFLPAKPIIIKSGLPNLSIVTSKLRTNLPVRN